MRWIKYQIHTTTTAADTIGEILCSLGICGFEITDHIPLTEKEEKQMYTDIPADLGEDDGSCILTFYTEPPSQPQKEYYSTGSSLRDTELAESSQPTLPPEQMVIKIKREVKKRQNFFPIPIPEITFQEEDDAVWKDKWKENFKPFRVTHDIIIKPSWEAIPDDATETDIILEIDPGSAFGTGTHETTRLCLKALRSFLRPDTRILDSGCGSGILAISALLCGADYAFCLDIDPNAVEATRDNARKNGIPDEKITAIRANILEEKELILRQLGSPVDIAVANILADVIVLLSECIGSFLKPDGIFIASGILSEKAAEVENALLSHHFHILERHTEGDWVCFVAGIDR